LKQALEEGKKKEIIMGEMGITESQYKTGLRKIKSKSMLASVPTSLQSMFFFYFFYFFFFHFFFFSCG